MMTDMELKAYRFLDQDEVWPDANLGSDYSLKSEADKVIEEKDKEIQRLENLCESYRIDCDNLAIREANACKEIERDNKQIRRQKYKRCLNMVKWCKYWANYWKCCEPPDCSLFIAKAKYYRKWQKRWLKIAKQFKEDK